MVPILHVIILQAFEIVENSGLNSHGQKAKNVWYELQNNFELDDKWNCIKEITDDYIKYRPDPGVPDHIVTFPRNKFHYTLSRIISRHSDPTKK